MKCSVLAVAAFASGMLCGRSQADEAFPPHRVVGNIYYVGSRDISSFLVTTIRGHVIINSGYEETMPLIRASVEKLGFRMSDIRVILASHAHSDHVAGHARLKEFTGDRAKVFVMKGDDEVIRSGGEGQYLYTDSRWPKCRVDRVLEDKDKVELGDTTLVAHRTAGHTRGCTTWTLQTKDFDAKKRDVVIVGSPNVNPGYQLVGNRSYKEIATDYAKGFAVLKKLKCDVFLGAHGKYYGMLEKHPKLKAGQPNPFIDPAGYRAYITEREQNFRRILAEQRKQAEAERTKIPEAVLANLEAHENLTYAKYGERELQLDLYRPKKTGRLPAVVCIHGGGWANGNRKGHGTLAKAIAARGYVAVTISYRLSGEATFPAAIHDCKAAVRWLRAHAEEYGIDAEHIAATGLSAGGHLVALLATSGGVKDLEGAGGNAEFSSTIQAAAPMGAQTDFESERTREISKTARGKIWRAFLGGTQEEQLETYRLASPLRHLDAKDPPLVFITGENDDPSTRAAKFREAANSLGLETGLTVVPGAPHPFLGKQVWFDVAVNSAVKLFDSTLKK